MALFNFKKNSFWGKVATGLNYINPFQWARKGVDAILGTNLAESTSLFGTKDENEDKGIAGVDLNNVTTSDLLDLAQDSTTTNVLAGAASAIPVVGPAISVALDAKSDLNDKQLGILQSAMEMQNNNEQAQINRDFQRQERLGVQDYNTDMWNMSNEYNSLEQQLARARSAGVSPNAIIGQGSNSGFTSPVTSSPQSGSTASYSSGLASTLINSGAMAENLMAQTKKLNTESKLNEQEFDFFKLTVEQRRELFDISVQKGNYENSNLYKDLELKNVSLDIQRGTFNMLCEMNEQELQLKKVQTIDLYNKQFETLNRIRLLEEQIKNEQKQGGLIDATTRKMEDEHLTSIYTREGQITQNEMLVLEKELKGIETSFCQIMGVPMGTPESMFMFYLWKQGRLWDWNAYIKANSFQTAPTLDSLHKIIDDIHNSNGNYKNYRTPPYTWSWKGAKGVYNPGRSLPKYTPKMLPLPGAGKTIFL